MSAPSENVCYSLQPEPMVQTLVRTLQGSLGKLEKCQLFRDRLSCVNVGQEIFFSYVFELSPPPTNIRLKSVTSPSLPRSFHKWITLRVKSVTT